MKKDGEIDDASSVDEDRQIAYKWHCQGIALKSSLKNATEDDWKKLCIENFDFVKEQFISHKNTSLTAAELAYKEDDN